MLSYATSACLEGGWRRVLTRLPRSSVGLASTQRGRCVSPTSSLTELSWRHICLHTLATTLRNHTSTAATVGVGYIVQNTVPRRAEAPEVTA